MRIGISLTATRQGAKTLGRNMRLKVLDQSASRIMDQRVGRHGYINDIAEGPQESLMQVSSPQATDRQT